MSKKPFTTREGWLTEAMKQLNKEVFKPLGYDLPKSMQVSVGFPFRSSKAIGQCFGNQCSADGTNQMFICPTQHEPVSVLATLAHEMIHASDNCESGHRGHFRKVAKEIGLAGKMTATYAEEGSELHETLLKIASRLGDYPHAAMSKSSLGGKSKQSKWIRMKSVNEDTYTLVISANHLDNFGYPIDPWGDEMVEKNPS